MRYLLLIHQGTTPLPGTDEWNALSQEEKANVYQAYKALNDIPGFEAGERMDADTATTVRVQDGRTLVTDGPYAELKESIGGYAFLEADDIDTAIEVAAKVPAASMGGGVEIRPLRA